MKELENIATELYDKLEMRFDDIETRDINSKPTADIGQARFFNFKYVAPRNIVSISITEDPEKTLEVVYGQGMVGVLERGRHRQAWYQLLKSLRKFARSYLMSFEVRDITRGIEKKNNTAEQPRSHLSENFKFGTLGGFRRSSRQRLGPVRIIIRHTAPVDDTQQGSRSRKIDQIYIEDHLGERRRMPTANLLGARAMARHVCSGGTFDDDLGNAILNMVSDLVQLRRFSRAMKHRQFEDSTTNDMVRAAESQCRQTKSMLENIKSARGYVKFKESFKPRAQHKSDEADPTQLRERFSRKMFPESLESTLPVVYRAYLQEKQRMQDLMSPRRAHDLACSRGSRAYAESINYTDGRSLAAHMLTQLAETINDINDPLYEFANRWAKNFSKLEERVDETLKEECDLAVQLAHQYIKGLREAQEIPSQIADEPTPPTNGDEDTADENQEFSNWANETEAGAQSADQTASANQPQTLSLGLDGSQAIMSLKSMGIINDGLRQYLEDLSKSGEDTVDLDSIREWLTNDGDTDSVAKLDLDRDKMDETLGGSPADDLIDSVEDPDTRRYGDAMPGGLLELYRRMASRI